MDITQQETFAFSYPTFRWWVGVVEDRNDPKKLGRLKVRVLGYHTEDKTDIPTNDLFWMFPIQPITSAAMNGIGYSPTGIVEGTWVVGFWRDGENAQDGLIMGTLGGIPNERNPDEGFFDPNDKYPKDDFMGEPDTNRLARGEKLDETIVQKKKDARFKEVVTAFNKKWEEPKVPEDREYPHNHVRETESGHVEEWDDTENSRRYHRYHRKGTFIEIHDDGKEVRHVVGDKYEIVYKDGHLYIKGNSDITIDGDANLLVKGTMNTEVHGDYNLEVSGKVQIQGHQATIIKSSGIYWVNAPTIQWNSKLAPKIQFPKG